MATYLTDEKEIYDLYSASQTESEIWRRDYHEYERLGDNGLMDDLDENLPEVNDGTLAASLFKLPKRIVSSKLKGRAKSLDRDEAWITELANMQWENEIIPNANSQAPFHRKWKDAVRKAAIYGSVPIITIFVERGDYIGVDFIVAQPQDVTLEAGKVSDYDSDVLFWDIFLTKLQFRKLIERAKKENEEFKENPDDAYNKWNIAEMEEILKRSDEDERDADKDHNQVQDEGVKRKGIKFCVVVQRGVDAPFYMYHKNSKKRIREWSNPDPTGDVPIHFLYCYQDFINPYGTGIVKLAGGTQNVLDYMRQVDVMATQLGFRPPVSFAGDTNNTDFDSIVYAQDAQWILGNAVVKREEISNQIYGQLPDRINMYKSSLNNLLPMGDTSVGAGAGDPLQSKTPAGVKLAAANLSIDDDDFKDNFYLTYAAVAKNMINTQFANMQGKDIMKLSDEERDLLTRAGLEFPVDEMGNPTNELEVIWDEARAKFDFEIDPEADKTKDDTQRLEGLMSVADFLKDPATQQLIMTGQQLILGDKKIDPGELVAEIISLTTDNEKIVQDVTPEDQEAEQQRLMQEQMMQQQSASQEQPDEVGMIMQEYGVDEPTAMGMIEASNQGYSPEEIQMALERRRQYV